MINLTSTAIEIIREMLIVISNIRLKSGIRTVIPVSGAHPRQITPKVPLWTEIMDGKNTLRKVMFMITNLINRMCILIDQTMVEI